MKNFAIVYQCGMANVFDVSPRLSKPRRLMQGAFSEAETFMRGAVAAGAQPLIFHCDETGDIAERNWKPGVGELFAENKSYA